MKTEYWRLKIWMLAAVLLLVCCGEPAARAQRMFSFDGAIVDKPTMGTPAVGAVKMWDGSKWVFGTALVAGPTNQFGSLIIYGSTIGVGFSITNNADGNYLWSLPGAGLSGDVGFWVIGTNVTMVARTNVYEFALGDETTAITTGTAKLTWRAPFAFTIKDVRASLGTVSSSGLPTVNIKESGTTIFSTKLTIDASEKTSTTAATPYVLSDTSIADDAEITFDIDVAGTGAAGLKVKIYYTR